MREWSLYEEWEYRVRRQLVDPKAIDCVFTPKVLEAWHKLRFSSTKIAKELNERFNNGYLERKAKQHLPTDNKALSVES